MTTLKQLATSTIRTGFLSLSVAVMTLGLPLVTYADEAPANCTAPSATEPGNRVPTGAAAATYTYNCGSGLWENEHYTYNPASQTYSPKAPVIYTYNATSGQYDYSIWEYSPALGMYYQATASVATPPLGAQIVGAPAPTPLNEVPTNTANATSDSANATTLTSTGPDSQNTTNTNLSNSTQTNNTTNASLNNVLRSLATTGNAGVINNTTGGDALTGNAQSIANIVNLLQSSSNVLGNGNLATFVSTIDGDINGDLLLDPAMLSTLQPASGTTTINNNTTFNNEVDASINNNITLAARSGDATVQNNTTAGNATTGNATAVANIVNTINSIITSGQSFLGVVNINGNLNGDILLPPNFIDQLVAANVPTVALTAPNSINSSNTTVNNSNTINNSNNLGVTNAVTSRAVSGKAEVSGNTTGGNATSGKADNNITAFNLTGSSLIGNNHLLVFVNVLGEWVGLIVNAPTGATAASLGGGVTSNTTINNANAVNNNVRQMINNTIDISAQSGDATVSSNTTGGNAKTGDAKTAVNLLNIQSSSFAFSDWFGILFINVFGRWNGSFGVNTSAGDPVAATAKPGSFGSAPTTSQPATPAQVFRFVPAAAPRASAATQQAALAQPTIAETARPATSTAAVLAASTQKPQLPAAAIPSTQSSLWRTASILTAVFTGFIIIEALLAARRNRSQA